MEESITTRLSEELLAKLDALVAQGVFANRNEAIQILLEQQLEWISEVAPQEELVEQLGRNAKLSDEDLLEIGKTLFGDRSVTDLVAEGRE